MSLEHLDSVDGWLDPLAAKVTDYLMRYQSGRGLVGDVLEIGVYHGKYFLVLLGALTGEERGLAVDLFGSEAPAIAGSAEGDLAKFNENLRHWAPERRVITLQMDSRHVTPYMLGEKEPFRFISVDGSHDHDTVLSDLALASATLHPGGVVALDDWRPEGNPQWPEVIDAEVTFQTRHPGRLLHIGSIPNKLLLSNDLMWVADYRKVLKDFHE